MRGQAVPLDLPGWLGAPGVPRLIAIGEPAQPDGWQNFMYGSWRTAGQYAKQHEPARQAPQADPPSNTAQPSATSDLL